MTEQLLKPLPSLDVNVSTKERGRELEEGERHSRRYCELGLVAGLDDVMLDLEGQVREDHDEEYRVPRRVMGRGYKTKGRADASTPFQTSTSAALLLPSLFPSFPSLFLAMSHGDHTRDPWSVAVSL